MGSLPCRLGGWEAANFEAGRPERGGCRLG